MRRVSGRLRVVIIVAVVAVGIAVYMRKALGAPRAVRVLSGPTVLGFVETAQGMGCMTVGGTVWSLSARAAEPRPLFRVDALVVSPPVSSDHALIAITADGTVCAWDSRDGSRLWQRPLSAPPTAPLGLGKGTVAVPLWPNALILLDVRTGAVKGKLVLGAAVRSAPMWWQGRWAMVTRSDELVLASDDGKILARQVVAGPVLAVAAWGDQLWLACAPNRVTLYTLTGPGPSAAVPSGISMLHAGDNMVLAAGANGELTCVFTRGTGVGIAWRRRLPGPVTSLAGPFVVNSTVRWAAATATGHVALIDADTAAVPTMFTIARAPVLFLAPNPPFLAAATADGVWLCPLPR